MNKYKKVFYILSVILGVSTIAAGTVIAAEGVGYGNGEKFAPQKADPEKDGSLFPGGICPNCSNDKDGSLFPGGECKTCTKDGSLFPGGPCERCTKDGSLFPGPCKKCVERKRTVKNFIPYTPVVYNAVARNCCQMAPLALAHVDFRIAKKGVEDLYSRKLGNYRFRIFGCRRFDKEATLNKGRILEKNVAFNDVFKEVVGDCYKVVDMPQDLCLETTPSELPEYVLTAEITDYFMNICDEYNWDEAQKNNARTGTSEITVVWRLMDLTKNTVYWKGESTGYGEVSVGEFNGEVKLIERAFADATSNLRNLPGFEDKLMERLTPADMAAQRAALIDEERALNPAKCGYAKEYECVKRCEIGRPGADISQCKPCAPCQCPCQNQTPIPAPVANIITIEPEIPVEIIDMGCNNCNCVTPVVEVTPVTILEDGGVRDSYEYIENEVQEQGNVVETFDIINSCIDENGNVKSDGMCQVVDDTWIDTGDARSLDNFCVVDTDPCKALSPETIYRMRSSIVQIESPNGRKGAGLLISDRFILTSADLVDKDKNEIKIKTIKNDELNARAVRINPSKNTALLMLDKSTEYTPLALNLSLPEVGRDGFLTLGLLDVNDFKDGEDYLENSARIEGYRYTKEKGAEILVNTFIQNVTVGGALIHKDCTINGMAHSGIKTDDGLDMFIPTETALRSLGISICGHEYVEESPWQQTVYKPVTEQIKNVQKAPEAMPKKDRK